MNTATIVAIVIAFIFLILLIKLIKTPLRWALKLLINAISGVIILFLTNVLGGLIGFSLDITWLNAIVAGLLGFPGILLLLAIKYLF
ncbi:MAG: pro-sigmaK processing inhibitor BofA [Clostridiales bacterium]|jgi:inhibitor of the pro-sigma K processing machinery|nr:pro-sigmaK processing inhibitor BofA [Clostridiales bacterium]